MANFFSTVKPRTNFGAWDQKEFGNGAAIDRQLLTWQPPESSDTEGKWAVGVPFRAIDGINNTLNDGDLVVAMKETGINHATIMSVQTAAYLCFVRAVQFYTDERRKRENAGRTTGKRHNDANDVGALLHRGMDFDPDVFFDLHKFAENFAVVGAVFTTSAYPIQGFSNQPSDYLRPQGHSESVLPLLLRGDTRVRNFTGNTHRIVAGTRLFLGFKYVPIDGGNDLRTLKGDVAVSADTIAAFGPRRHTIAPVWFVSESGRPPTREHCEAISRPGEPCSLTSALCKDWFVDMPLPGGGGTVPASSTRYALLEGHWFHIGMIVFDVQPTTTYGRHASAAGDTPPLYTPEQARALPMMTVNIHIQKVRGL